MKKKVKVQNCYIKNMIVRVNKTSFIIIQKI